MSFEEEDEKPSKTETKKLSKKERKQKKLCRVA